MSSVVCQTLFIKIALLVLYSCSISAYRAERLRFEKITSANASLWSGTVSSYGAVIDEESAKSSVAMIPKLINTSDILPTSFGQLKEAAGTEAIVKNLANTAMEPVTVGVLLGISVLGSLFNAAITQARLSEAQRTLAALQSASQKLLAERSSVCLATRALSFQSTLLSAQTDVFIKAAFHVLEEASFADIPPLPATEKDMPGATHRPPTRAEVEAAYKNMLVTHTELLQEHARHRERSVRALCAQQVDTDLRAMQREKKVYSEAATLRDKLMNDWVSVLSGSFLFTMFDPAFQADLEALPTASKLLAEDALEGVAHSEEDLLQDSQLQEINSMVKHGKAPLWILRALNAISHFLDSGILGVPTHAEVITSSIRAGILTIHELIAGNLRTAITTKDPAVRIREFFHVIENSFSLICDVYRIIYGVSAVVPWNIVGVFAIFQSLHVMFEVGTNWAALHQQVAEHRQILRMSDIDALKQRLTYKFSACLSFVRAERLASEQFDFLLAFERMLEALPAAPSHGQNGTAPVSASNSFEVEPAILIETIQHILDESPQFVYQALLGPRSKLERSSVESESLGVLLRSLSDIQVVKVQQAALWGPITDLAISNNAQQDAAYEAMGFFQPVLGWRLWACRGCSRHRIVHAVVCYGTEIVDCLQRNEALAQEQFGAITDALVEVLALPSPQPEVAGGFSQIYRKLGVRPRLLFVTAAADALPPDTSVLMSLEWGRLAYSVFGKMHYQPAPGRFPTVSDLEQIDKHNRQAAFQEAGGKKLVGYVQHLVQQLGQETDALDVNFQTGIAVRKLWDGYARLNAWSKDSHTGQFRKYTGPSLRTAVTGNPTTLLALDVATATFKQEHDLSEEALPFTKVLITAGYSCHWATALRLRQGVHRVRTPAYFHDAREDLDHAMIEGWLFNENAWQGQAGEEECSGYQRMLQDMPAGCTPLSVVDLSLQSLPAPEAPETICTKKVGRALSVASVVEDAVFCVSQECSLQKADSQHWEFAGQWAFRARAENASNFELWVRRVEQRLHLSSLHAAQPVAVKQNLPRWSRHTGFQLQRFRAVLANALCSPQQCHFRDGPETLPQLLGLPGGPARVPYYLSQWEVFDNAEVLTFGRGLYNQGQHRFAGMPQLAFARRRRQPACGAATQYLRNWANQHRSASTLLDLHSLGNKVQALGIANISAENGFELEMLNALGEVHQASNTLPECAISSNDTQSVHSLMDALLAAAAHTGSGECGFELLVPVQPQVVCQEADGDGLQLFVHPDATILEHCANLDEQPSVDNYLIWLSLRPQGSDELGVNARRTAREIEHALTSVWGYSAHMPLSQQAQGCLVPLPDEQKEKTDATRLVFRQEVWTRLDPRLSGQSLQITQQQMCELKEKLQHEVADVGMRTSKHDAQLLAFDKQIMD